MKKRIILLLLSVLLILTGCANAESESTDTSELPAIIFLVRTDISDTLSEEEAARQDVALKTLGFYDKYGNYYISADPEINAMDNKTLAAEYEAGHLTEQIRYYTSCDADVLAKQYAKLHRICLKGQPEIVYPDALPAVQAESSTWYGFYFDRDGNLQYQTIHQKERLTNLYTDNDTVNEIYDRIIETFKNTEQSE